MNVNNPEFAQQPNRPTPEVWLPDDEIDLREYVLVLVAWWREIVLISVGVAFLAALTVLVLRNVTPPVYESSATVAIARTQSNITFDDRFTTLSAEDAANLQSSSAARRAALLGLVANGEVAQAVIDRLGDLLDEEERNPAELLGNERVVAALVGVSGNQNASDLIRITVTADSAKKAAAIVNAWAELYVIQVNRIYGQVPNELVASIARELNGAQVEYETAQGELEAFVAANQVDRLNRLIVEKQGVIASLGASRRSLVTAIIDTDTASRLHAIQSEQSAKTRLFDTYVEADVQAKLAVFDQEVQSRRQLLATYYEDRARLQRLRNDAANMRVHSIQAGEAGAATNSLALLLLKVQVYATAATAATAPTISTMSPSNLQIALGNIGEINVGAQSQLVDLEGLIQALDSRLTELDQLIISQSNMLLDNAGYNFLTAKSGAGSSDSSALAADIQERYQGLLTPGPLASESLAISTTTPVLAVIRAQYPDLFDDGALATIEPLAQAINQLELDIQLLQAQQEAESSRRQQLAQRRDLAWSTLTTLRNKSAELQLSSTATNSEVRLAAPGVEPIEPIKGLGLITTTGLAGIVGLMLAVFGVFLANFMDARPWLGRATEHL